MKTCIIGAGAIGGFIGARLAAAGHPVSAVARGATLAALRTHGWRADSGSTRIAGPLAAASEHPAELGSHDLVVIAVKGQSLTAVAERIAPLIGEHTIVMPAMNGVPWWFCEPVAGFPGGSLDSVDPGGRIGAAIATERVLGCVVHISASTPEPGLVRHAMGDGLIIGEPAGGRSDRAQRVVDLLADAGFRATHHENIREPIWYKLWGNLTMNPVSAITGAPIDAVLADPLVRAFCSAAMVEANAIGARIGCPIDETPEARHSVTAKLGGFKTSMLQDAEAGRPLELDAIVGAVVEIARRLGVPTPNIDALFGLTRLFGRMHGLYSV
ncbi:MAG: 2-dehydropantoate 2-reductase [Burkholderiaceae bacterium]